MGVKIKIEDGTALIYCTMCTENDHNMKIKDIAFSKQCSNLNYDTTWPMGGIIIYDCGNVCVNSRGENLCDKDKAFIFVKDSKTIKANWKRGDAGQIHGTLTRMITGHSAKDFFDHKGCLGGFSGDEDKKLKYTSRSLNYHTEDPDDKHREYSFTMTDTERLVVSRSIRSWENMLLTRCSPPELTCRVRDLFPKLLSCNPNNPDHPSVINERGNTFSLEYMSANIRWSNTISLETVHVSCKSDGALENEKLGVIIYDMPSGMRKSKIKWRPGYIFFKSKRSVERHYRDKDYKLDSSKSGTARLIQILTDIDVAEVTERARGIYNSFAVKDGQLRFLWNASPIERKVITKAVNCFVSSGGRCQTVKISDAN